MQTEYLRSIFSYNEDGTLTRKRRMGSRPAGEVVKGTFQSDTRYRKIYVNCKNVYLHRVIYQLVTGIEPNYIDHINGNREDNSIENLRNVDQCRNMQNLNVKQKSKLRS